MKILSIEHTAAYNDVVSKLETAMLHFDSLENEERKQYVQHLDEVEEALDKWMDSKASHKIMCKQRNQK